MNTTTYTNSNILVEAVQANNEDFHRRLRELYPCVDDVSKLPQTWSPESKASPLGLTHDNLGCYFRGNGRREEDEKFAAAVRTDNHIPPSCLLYYFEIKFISKGREGFMGLGLTSGQTTLTKLPGWARESYGYHADDGNIFNGDGRGNSFGPTFTTGDTIGCGLNLVEGKCFFTKNGLNLGKAFDDIPSNIRLFPTIGLKTPGEEVRANFGQEDFVYDILQDMRSLKKNMTLTISNYPITDFGSWQSTLHKLVQSWLLQNSYPATADAFTRSAKLECKENLQRIQQRNRIQQLVLNGRISEAIQQTNRLCPNLLENNPNLLFALKCRQFIELISGADNDFQPILTNTNRDRSDGKGTNGKLNSNGDQLKSDNHSVRNNGCNGDIGGNSCGIKSNDRQSTSSNSLHDLMDVDQPLASMSSANDYTNQNSLNSNNKTAVNIGISNNNLSSIDNNDLHLSTQTQISAQNESNKMDSNRITTNGQHNRPLVDIDFEINEQKFAKLLKFGRELSDYSQHLDKLYGKNETNEKMLQEAIGLIAYTNPRASCFGKLLEPNERESICQLLNSSIVKAEMGDSYKPPLEEVMNHLRKLVKLNDSHGRWLLDRLY